MKNKDKFRQFLVVFLMTAGVTLTIQSYFFSEFLKDKMLADVNIHITGELIEYHQVLKDYQEDIVSKEYAALLMKRKVQSIDSIWEQTLSADYKSLENPLSDLTQQLNNGIKAVQDGKEKQFKEFQSEYEVVANAYIKSLDELR